MKLEFFIGVELLQARTELAAEHYRERLVGEEKMRRRTHPARTVSRGSAAGDNAVQMVMTQQRLTPRVQDGGDAQLNAPTVLPKLQQGLARCHKQERVECALVLLDQRIELVRQASNALRMRQ